MTDKPEVIFVHPDAFSDEPAMYTTARQKIGPGPEIAAIRLTDHEASRAADKARIADLEQRPTQNAYESVCAGICNLREQNDELLTLLHICRDYVYCELENERQAFRGHEGSSSIPSIEADLSRIDAILGKHK